METKMIQGDKDKGRILDDRDTSIAARYRLNDIFCTAWLSHAISAVAKHAIPDILDDEPLSIQDIAAKKGLHVTSLYRALRALAANGIFIEVKPGYFAHNEISRLLRSDNPFSWRGMALMWNHPACLSAWSKFSQSLSDGRSGIEHAFNKPLYQHLHDDPAAKEAFSDAMISNSAHVSQAIARAFPFQQYQSVVDLGGGVGTQLVAILAEHANLTGVLFEIADLQVMGEHYLREHGLSTRAKFVAGDFLESVIGDLDLYLVKNSLWNWNDDHCLTIMRNVRAAIGNKPDSKFIIIEYVIDAENAAWTTLYDLQILNMPGGNARTLAEYEKLLSQAGFMLERAIQVEDQTLLVAKPQ